ncbi:cation efflux system protein [Kaistia sp. 32K]|uniref:efflux RND transporter periplasmic adaptor subunit n=1 Tax=Kaistia sp. 32K TaxID=2795690 RepID=UPI001936295D|nr:efflux RND transporter periplasmic adaptor subunit [Kaistia sp. 32K]BCP52276.1 cation efflux system protein [Kaistia sp. 32K]
MSRAGRTGLTLAAILAAGAGGYWAGHRDLALPDPSWLRAVPWLERAVPPAKAEPAPSGPVLYYRDPDGKPAYSAARKKTADGRDFLAIHAGQDANFDEQPAPPKVAVAPADSDAKRVLYYRNPMGLPDTSATPKKDSMGMDYIPVYEGDNDDGSSVKVSPGRLQRTGVRTEAAAERVIVNPVRVPGVVQLDERRVTVVSTRSDAFINAVANVTTGDRITRGQALLQLYSPEVAAAGAQFLTDLSSGGRDRALGGARQRLENLGVPAEAIAEIERTRKLPLSITWPAPRDGIVLQRSAVEGMKAAPGDVLFRLADVSTVWVVADVPEYQLGAVEVGATATIRLRSRPGESFSGRVALIYPQVAADTRTTKVRIEIPNPDGVLLPDMYADVEIASGSGRKVVSVPDNAVIDTGDRQIVIVDKGDGRFEPREVRIGQQGGGLVEIRSGIAAADKVVVAANFLIDAESNLKAALNGMTSAEATP